MKLNLTTAAILLALAATGSASATTVYNVNIGNQGLTGYQGAATENAATGSSWNALTTDVATNLVDSTGTASTVTIDISDDTDFGTTGNTVGDTIFKSWVKDGGSGAGVNSEIWTATFGNLSGATTYDVVIYTGWFWGPESIPVNQTAGTGLSGTFNLNSPKMDGSVLATGLAEDTSASTTAGDFNYARFNGLSADGLGNITFSFGINAPSQNDFAVNGFQLVEVPEPSSLALLGLGGLLIARRRRG